jgi:hypothetical protein
MVLGSGAPQRTLSMMPSSRYVFYDGHISFFFLTGWSFNSVLAMVMP